MRRRVVPFNGPTPTNGHGALRGLPPCPVTNCARCGKSVAEAGWVTKRWGCKSCTPPEWTWLVDEACAMAQELIDLKEKMAAQPSSKAAADE